ncbi:MAG: phage tail protein [Candidatus Dormiibacterota bacterium]
MADEEQYGLSLRYNVVIDDLSLGDWTKCEGLEVSFDVCKYQYSDAEKKSFNFTYYAPGRTSYTHITLRRGLSQKGSKQVLDYLKKVQQTPPKSGASGSITLHDAWNNQVMQWDLNGVMPIKWSGPKLDANGKDVAVEELVLCHQGFLD